MNRRTLLPTYLILALCATGPLHAQAHAPGPCHTGELWTTAFPGLSPGAFVHIPAGVTIVLNTATVDLGGLFVEGRLVFDHTVPGDTVHLNTAYAVVTGSLQIGCKDATGTITRFTKKTSITLIAPERYGGAALFPADAGVNWHATIAAAFPHPGGVAADNEVYQAALDRGLAIVGSNVADQGELRIYGNSSRLQGWTTLAATAAAGNLIVGLNAALAGPWKVGDELAIASSDFEYADQIADGSMIGANKMGGHLAGYVQGEERTIAAIGATASELVLNLPLTHGHWSAAVSAPFPSGVQSVPEQTEVANLTRSVVIRGEISAFSGSQWCAPRFRSSGDGYFQSIRRMSGLVV